MGTVLSNVSLVYLDRHVSKFPMGTISQPHGENVSSYRTKLLYCYPYAFGHVALIEGPRSSSPTYFRLT